MIKIYGEEYIKNIHEVIELYKEIMVGAGKPYESYKSTPFARPVTDATPDTSSTSDASSTPAAGGKRKSRKYHKKQKKSRRARKTRK